MPSQEMTPEGKIICLSFEKENKQEGHGHG